MMVEGLPNDVFQMTMLDVRVEAVTPLPCLKVVESSRVEKLGQCTKTQLHQVTELCSGMGAFSSEWEAEGFQVRLGVDQNPVWQDLFVSAHSASTPDFVAAAAGSTQTVKAMYDRGLVHGTVLAGVSCQPFSRLGDGAGMDDTRSNSLYEVLSTGWLTQSAVIGLECVAQVVNHPRFQEALTEFCRLTGYHQSQQVIDLKDFWCARRQRWYCILTAPVLGQCPLPKPAVDPRFQKISQVMPYVKEWPVHEHQQLELDLYELNKYQMYSINGVESNYLSLDGVLPTCLHSAGNQMYRCACGCRPALHIRRLEEKGLIGTLIPMDEWVPHGHSQLRKARYLHPAEMMLMNGGLPTVNWDGKMRLSLSGVGQCVSPLVGCWVAAHVRQLFDRFLCQSEVINPEASFEACKQRLLASGKALWPEVPSASVHSPGNGIISVQLAETAPVSVAVTLPCTVGQLRRAESEFHPEVMNMIACTAEGDDVSDEHPLWAGGDFFFRPNKPAQHPSAGIHQAAVTCAPLFGVDGYGEDVGGLLAPSDDDAMGDHWMSDVGEEQEDQVTEVPHVVPGAIDVPDDPLCQMDMQRLLELECPCVNSVADVHRIRSSHISQSSRTQVHDVTLRNRHIHKHVCDVHVKTAKSAVSSAAPKASDASVAAVLPEVIQADAAPLPVTEWSWSQAMSKKLGESSLRKVSEWWVALGVPVHDGLTQHRWISWFHLYASFVRRAQVVGPICVNRRWLDGDDVEGYHTLTSMQRVRTFQRFLRVFWDHHGFNPPGKYTRCCSTNVDVRLNCVYLCWPPDDLELTDRQVAASIGVVKKPGQLDGFGFGEG
eukprot:Skav230442  [mRNA]  locus=scaffold3496:46177:55671:- [translate_table: standard]